MTREEARERAECDVDHCMGVMSQCADEMWTHYGEVYGHQPVIDKKAELVDVADRIRKLLTAINQAQTARPLPVLAAG